jgi:hypothetical protein
MVSSQSQPCIIRKIKQINSEEFDYMLCDPWIEPLLGHKLISLEDLKSKQGFFLRLFKEKKPKGKFFLSPTTEVVGCSSLKKNTTWKSAKK